MTSRPCGRECCFPRWQKRFRPINQLVGVIPAQHEKVATNTLPLRSQTSTRSPDGAVLIGCHITAPAAASNVWAATLPRR
jgi:hypothetical protein